MKKHNYDSHKNVHSKSNEVIHINSPPKKQFQLLYRERDAQLSSDAYESIIFVKSKKCDNKSTHSKRKMSPKHKKKSVQQMKKLITDLQKQFKTQDNVLNKIKEQPKRNKIAKNSTLKTNPNQNKDITEVLTSKLSKRLTKVQSKQYSRDANTKQYKNIGPVLKDNRYKPDQNNNLATNIQQTFRKETKSKQKKRGKTRHVDQLNFPATDQYILLENNFLRMDATQSTFLHEKLLSTRNQHQQSIQEKAIKFHNQFHGLQNNSPIDQQNYQDFDNQFHQFIADDESDQNDKNELKNSADNYNSIFYENNLEVVQKYIVSKVKIIQRWIRKMLNKIHHQRSTKGILPNKPLSNSPQNEFQQKSSFNLDSLDGNLLGSLRQISGQCDPSPIKMAEQLYLSDKKDPSIDKLNDSLQMRMQAAQAQMNTHHSILEKMYKSNKITQIAYLDKKSVIESKYKYQLQQIEQIKTLLRSNAQKAYSMTQKTNKDLKMFANLQNEQVNLQILQQIFGKNADQQPNENIKRDQQNQTNINYAIVGRQKSTGCHFNSNQTVKPMIYTKTKESENTNPTDPLSENNSLQQNQFYHKIIKNIQHAPPTNLQFKQLLDEYKITQQIKMQIDKRAAIQMGVIVQQLPPEIKDEYIGIDTSLNNIHRFLLAFFKFYIFYYKDQFLRLINMPYGHNINKRIKFIQGYQEDQDIPAEDDDGVIYGLESVISQQVLDQFYDKVFDLSNNTMSNTRLANFQFDKVHNRALFDCFNEALNYFRPYFLIDGPPYPWNNSEKALTFYFIAEDNIQEVFEKSQFKVLKWASTLCGILVNKYINDPSPVTAQQSVEEMLQIYRNSCHPLLAEARQDRYNKNEKVEGAEDIIKWSLQEEEKTQICFQVSEYIFGQIMTELLQQVLEQLRPTLEKQLS